MTYRSIHVHGQADVRMPERRVVVATDASVYDDGTGVALAYLSSHGHYGLKAHPYPGQLSGAARSTVCELRAILLAIEHVFDRETRAPVRVITDSVDALQHLKEWRAGGDRMPPGYSRLLRSSGTQSSLVTLSRKVHRHQMISFRLVTGHSGHPLNETADSLAKLGLRHGRQWIDGDDVRRLVPMWAARGHTDYVNSLETSERGNG